MVNVEVCDRASPKKSEPAIYNVSERDTLPCMDGT